MACIGGGKFGSRAADEGRSSGARVLVIDRNPHCRARDLADRVVDDPDRLREAVPGEVLFFQGDGVAALGEILAGWTPDVVVPASSGHLAAQLAVQHLWDMGRELTPTDGPLPEVKKALPTRSLHLADENNGVLVTSFMEPGSLCQQDCEQPSVCPIRNVLEPIPMHERIREALERNVDRSIVLVTGGAGGVGGVSGSELRSMLSSIEGLENGQTCGIATACRCHGIINLLRVRA